MDRVRVMKYGFGQSVLHRRRKIALAAVTLALVSARAAGPELLIASPGSSDPDFGKSVILLVRNGAGGAVGLMLNRPARANIGDLFPELRGRKAVLYAGGPVNLGVNALVRSDAAPAGAEKVFGNVWLIAERARIGRLAVDRHPGLRIFIGQCGWTGAQLREEFRRGLWIAADPDAGAVFDASPETLWSRWIARLGRK